MRLGTVNLSCYDGMHTVKYGISATLPLKVARSFLLPPISPGNARNGVEMVESLMHDMRNNLYNY